MGLSFDITLSGDEDTGHGVRYTGPRRQERYPHHAVRNT